MTDMQANPYDFEPEEDLGIDSNGYEMTVNSTDGRALSQAFHSNRTSYPSNAENSLTNGATVFDGANEFNRSRVVSESENGDVFLNSSCSQGYSSMENGFNGSVVNQINFTRNGSLRNSSPDTSTSSDHSGTELTSNPSETELTC